MTNIPTNKNSSKSYFSFSGFIALLTLLLIAIRAANNVDPHWDTLAYHWPFAARISDLCNASCLTLQSTSEWRYEGFPKLWHWFQGIVWRITGSPSQIDLLNLVMVVIVCTYLKSRFTVPLAWSWLAFLAIPETQIELTTSYIDLPMNAALTLAVLVIVRLIINPDKANRTDLIFAFLALFLVTNSKFQLVPVALLLWMLISAIFLVNKENPSNQNKIFQFVVMVSVGSLVLCPLLLLNLFKFGNPFYPIIIDIGPIHLSGKEPMVSSIAVSDFYVNWPGPFRWIASVLEFDAFQNRPLPWTIGQGEVPQSSPSFRMGGFFVAYVLGMISLLIWSAKITAKGRLILLTFAAISLLCSFLPLSYESRYYSFWMLSLISLVLIVTHSSVLPSDLQSIQRGVTYGAISIAFISVISMTGASYLKTKSYSLKDLIKPTEAIVSQVPDGSTLCILNRAREAIIYSTVFHPNRNYQTKVLWGEEVDPTCTLRLDTNKNTLDLVR